MAGSIGIDRIWTGMFVLLDLLGIWLLVHPGGLARFRTARRTLISGTDRLIGRLVGALILWTQFLRWAGPTKNRNVHVALEGSLFLILATAAVFVAFKIVGSIRSNKSSGKSVGKDEWRAAGPESEAETKARYQAAWARLRRLRVAFRVLLFAWLPFAYLLFSAFRLLRWDQDVAMIVVLAWIPFMPVAGWKWSYWKCPRCGYAFKGKYDLLFPKHCHHCGLPMWAESPDR